MPKWVYKLRGLRQGNRIITIGILCRPREGRKDNNGDKDGGKKFLGGYTFHLRIQSPAPTLLAALMWK